MLGCTCASEGASKHVTVSHYPSTHSLCHLLPFCMWSVLARRHWAANNVCQVGPPRRPSTEPCACIFLVTKRHGGKQRLWLLHHVALLPPTQDLPSRRCTYIWAAWEPFASYTVKTRAPLSLRLLPPTRGRKASLVAQIA